MVMLGGFVGISGEFSQYHSRSRGFELLACLFVAIAFYPISNSYSLSSYFSMQVSASWISPRS